MLKGVKPNPNWKWRQDKQTERFLQTAKYLDEPETMTPKQLAAAVTYIVGIDNPYARVLAAKAGKVIELEVAISTQEKERAMEVLRDSAKELGIRLI